MTADVEGVHMRKRRTILILALGLLLFGMAFVVYAFYHSYASFPAWIPVIAIKTFYALLCCYSGIVDLIGCAVLQKEIKQA